MSKYYFKAMEEESKVLNSQFSITIYLNNCIILNKNLKLGNYERDVKIIWGFRIRLKIKVITGVTWRRHRQTNFRLWKKLCSLK